MADICLISVSFIPNDKYKMHQNGRLLCGMAATGEIFRLGGILVLIYFHLMTVANPYRTFSDVSFLRLVTALLVFAESGGARLSDTSMCGTVQFGVHCTGNPLYS